ncbi:ZNF667 [Branchiostoma lanceolatum]|uniref:ZNF667 protein n=1 Tax=Branchiostoma lanceolatum TaxID=7740 RepID=A0A8K0EQH2_BRALA|nr:ZNF667 [Branchiostoma lanceolatum]
MDQAGVRTSQTQESSRRGSHIDPLQFAVPLSVIQQPRRVGFGDTQKWTVVKQEDTAGCSLQENITPFLKEHSKQENTTKPQEKTTPPLQENIKPTPQQKPVLSPQDEKFGCETCGKVYKVKSLFQSHLDDHRKGFTQVDNMLYRCDTCNREFATQTSVLYHMRIHNRLKCLDCSFVCSKKKVLAKHICPSKKTKTEKGSKKRKIDTQIQNVIKQEYNAGSNQENIPQPQESTPRKESVISSQQSKATLLPRDEKFACKTCGKEFKVKSLYQSHIQDHEKGFTHSDTTTYRCDTCDREFATPTAVMYHLRIHKMLRCPECTFSCSKKKLLEKHVCKHKKVRTGHCQTCSATFPTRAQLNKHYAQHRDHLPVACPWEGCTLRFEHLSNLVQHQVVHTGESRYICEYCGQQFKHAQNLKVHIRIHTDEKPFKCDKCDYSGRQQHALDWHNRSHHGIPIPKRSKVNVELSNHGSQIHEGSKGNVNSSDQDSSIPEGSKDNVNSRDQDSSISEGSKDNVNSRDQDSSISEGSKDNVSSRDQDSLIPEGSKTNVNSSGQDSSIPEGSKDNVNSSSDQDSSIPDGSKVNVNSSDQDSSIPEGSKDNVNSSDQDRSKDNVNSSDQDSSISEGSKDNVNSSDQNCPIPEGSKAKGDTGAD